MGSSGDHEPAGSDHGRPRQVTSAAGWRARAGSLEPCRRWMFWPHTVRGWWATLERELDARPTCTTLGQPGDRSGARSRGDGRRSGRGPARRGWSTTPSTTSSKSNNSSACPESAGAQRGGAAWASAADAPTTVNEALAERLAARWGGRPTGRRPELARGRRATEPDPDGGPLRGRSVSGPIPDRAVPGPARAAARDRRSGRAVLGSPTRSWPDRVRARSRRRARPRDGEPQLAGRHFTSPPATPTSSSSGRRPPTLRWSRCRQCRSTSACRPQQFLGGDRGGHAGGRRSWPRSDGAGRQRSTTSERLRRRPTRPTWPTRSPRSSTASRPMGTPGGTGSQRRAASTLAGAATATAYRRLVREIRAR